MKKIITSCLLALIPAMLSFPVLAQDFEARERESVRRDLQSDDEEVRRLAIDRSAALPAAEATPYYVECLGDPSWRVRKAAVERLVSCPETTEVAGGMAVGGMLSGRTATS